MSANAKTSKEYKELFGEHLTTTLKDDFCGFCGCDIDYRTAALSYDCGATYYNKNNPDKPQQEVKWTKEV